MVTLSSPRSALRGRESFRMVFPDTEHNKLFPSYPSPLARSLRERLLLAVFYRRPHKGNLVVGSNLMPRRGSFDTPFVWKFYRLTSCLIPFVQGAGDQGHLLPRCPTLHYLRKNKVGLCHALFRRLRLFGHFPTPISRARASAF